MKAPVYAPFVIPDFKVRPDGASKTLKEAYSFLRTQGFPEKDLFIFPQGEFESFKGEILNQQPTPGEIVSPGERVILIAAMPGICELMPDLFTDHREDFLDDSFTPLGGAKRLFSVIDSAFIKMLCRLEWIRDVYSGISSSAAMVDYIGSLLEFPERKLGWASQDFLGYILPGLYGYLGTESALGAYINAVTGLPGSTRYGGMQTFPLPESEQNRVGQKGRLGADLYLGAEFKGAEPAFDFSIALDDSRAVESIIPGQPGHSMLRDILSLALPRHEESCSVIVDPRAGDIRFELAASFLGYSTVAGGIGQ
jgi:hypothetical protein